MTRNEELLTVTDENEEKLRSLVEKAKTYAPELFQRHYKITPEEFEKTEYTRTFGYGVFEDGVIEGCIGVALDLRICGPNWKKEKRSGTRRRIMNPKVSILCDRSLLPEKI